MLSEVPEGWSHGARLSSYVQSSTQKWDGKQVLPYLGLEHIEQGTGNILEFGESKTVSSSKNLFESGDVLFGKLRPNLRKYWKAACKGICSTDILVLRPKDGIVSDFLFVLVQSEPFLNFAVNDAAGTKMPRTSWKRLSEIEFSLPPLPEQKRIAEILSSVDESIQATQSVIDQAERVKINFCRQIVSGTAAEFPSHESAPITSICEVNPSQVMSKGETYKFIEMAKLPIARSSIESFEFREFRSGGSRFKNGDTLFARITPCAENGKLGFVDFLGTDEMGFGSTEFTVLRPLIDAGKIIYIYCYAGLLRDHVLSQMIGSTGRQRIPNTAYSGVNIAMYDASHQERIIDIFSFFEKAQNDNLRILQRQLEMKKGLMDDLLTGKVRTV